MEVLPCSGVQYVGESDRSQQSSGTVFLYDGEANCLEHGKQVQMGDGKPGNLLLNVEGPQIEKQGEVKGTVDELPTSEGHCSGASNCDSLLEDQNLSSGSHDFEDDDVNVQNYCTDPCMPNREEESSLAEPTWLEGDESVALWVKVIISIFLFFFTLYIKNILSFAKFMVFVPSCMVLSSLIFCRCGLTSSSRLNTACLSFSFLIVH